MSKADVLLVIGIIIMHFFLEYRAYCYGVLKGIREEHKIIMEVLDLEESVIGEDDDK